MNPHTQNTADISELTGFFYEPTYSWLVVGSTNVPRVYHLCLVNNPALNICLPDITAGVDLTVQNSHVYQITAICHLLDLRQNSVPRSSECQLLCSTSLCSICSCLHYKVGWWYNSIRRGRSEEAGHRSHPCNPSGRVSPI